MTTEALNERDHSNGSTEHTFVYSAGAAV